MELRIERLIKNYKEVTAVDDVSYTLTSGVYGLLGVNGAGKTTLMRMLCTLLKPSAGAIYCDEKDIFGMDGYYRRLLGYLPQDFGFYPDFTAHEFMLYMAAVKGLDKRRAK